MKRRELEARLALYRAWTLCWRWLIALAVAAGAFFALRALWARADLGVLGRVVFSLFIAAPAGIGIAFDLDTLPGRAETDHDLIGRTRSERLRKAAIREGIDAMTALDGLHEPALLARIARGDMDALSGAGGGVLPTELRLAALAKITDMDLFCEIAGGGLAAAADTGYDWRRFSEAQQCEILRIVGDGALRGPVFFALLRTVCGRRACGPEHRATRAASLALCRDMAAALGLLEASGFCPHCGGRDAIELDAASNRGAAEEYGETYYFDGDGWVASEEPFYHCRACGERRFGDFSVSMRDLLSSFS